MSEYQRIQASNAGMKAFREGKSSSACDRPRGTIFYDDWQDGYAAAEQSTRLSATQGRE